MATLENKRIRDTYKDLLQVSSGSNTGIGTALATIEDGEGTTSALQISTTEVRTTGNLTVQGAVAIDSVLGITNNAVATTSIANIEIKSNGTQHIDLGEPTSEDYDLRIIHQGGGVTLDTAHSTRSRVESSAGLGFVVDADPNNNTPGAEVFTVTKTALIVNDPGHSNSGVGVDLVVNDDQGTEFLRADASSNMLIVDKLQVGDPLELYTAQDAQASVTTDYRTGFAVISTDSDGAANGLGMAVMYLRAPSPVIQFQDTDPAVDTTTIDYSHVGHTWNFGVDNGAMNIGLIGADYADAASVYTLTAVQNVDGSDGNGGAYPWDTGLGVWVEQRILGGTKYVGLDSSDVYTHSLVNTGDNITYCDLNSNWNFRKMANAGDTRFAIRGHSSAPSTSVGNNLAMQMFMQNRQVLNGTTGYRNSGRTQSYVGTTSTHKEAISGNVEEYHWALQYQRAYNRVALDYFYNVLDQTTSNYGNGTATGLLNGAKTGSIIGIQLRGNYIDGNGTAIDSCLAPTTSQSGFHNLGTSTGRWKQVYATNSSISTSDEREKQDIEVLNDAEQAVAVTLKGLIKKYRWKKSVLEKGDDARIHVGVIAQEVEQAFTDAGLDARRYSLFCVDTVYHQVVDGVRNGITQSQGSLVEVGEGEDPETTNITLEAEEVYSIRYNELLAFIISAL